MHPTKTIRNLGRDITVKVVKAAQNSPLEDDAAWSPGMDKKVYGIVENMINDIEKRGEVAVTELAKKFDNWPEGKSLLLSKDEIQQQISVLSQKEKDDIDYQQERVRKFAQAQLEHTKNFEMEISPGCFTGQKLVPCNAVGCYIPGGRYSHISTAAMTVVTAKVAGVKRIVACSPPMRGTTTIHPSTLYALNKAGADHIMVCGGAQAIASMAFGLFTNCPVDMIVGPGNSFVAEAKRFLYGKVGIDMFAGPTEIAILADDSADPFIIATDLISQAEHGPTSPAWLITTSEKVAEESRRLAVDCINKMPADNACYTSWPACGEILLCESQEDMLALSDRYAAEHLQVFCRDLDWWLNNLTNYGSLFLGEETCVTYGDKVSGPNHTLPTLRGARYTAGLGVDKFVKKLTYQRMTPEANRELGPRAARISRMEGMEGHARSGDVRMEKYFPGEAFDLGRK